MKYLWTIVILLFVVNLHAADMRITDLATDSTPDADSLLVLVDEPAGVATNVNCTVWQLKSTLSYSLDDICDYGATTDQWISVAGLTSSANINVTGIAEATTLTENGNAVYSSGEVPGGELGGTFASFTVDDGALDDQYLVDDANDATTGWLSVAGLTSSANVNVTGTVEGTTLTEGGVAVHNNDEMDASAELLAIMDDETGTGALVFADDATINVDGGTLELPQETDCVGHTGEGQACWDTDTDMLYIGDGSVALPITGGVYEPVVTAGSLSDNVINNADINWADLTYLTDEGVGTGYTPNRTAKFDSSGNLTGGGIQHYDRLWIDYPNSLAESGKRIGFGDNRSGQTFTITEMHVGASETIPDAFGIYVNSAGDITSTSNALEAKTSIDISGGFAAFVVYDQTSGFDDPTVADDEWIVLDWDTGTPTFLKIDLWGYY